MILSLAPRFLPWPAVLVLLAGATPAAAARPTYVVSLSSDFRIPITVGSHAIEYEQTADTGSGIVNFPCSASCPFYYNPLNSSTFKPPSAAACVSFENGNSTCAWNYTYHPSNEVISGDIVKDTLTLSTSSPPLSFSALLGCTLHDTWYNSSIAPCPSTPGTTGSFGGVDRGNSSIISQLYTAKMVDNVVGFCAPQLPPHTGSAVPTSTYMTLGSARPVGLSAVKRTDFLSPAELAVVGAANNWTDAIVTRMSLRYLAVFTTVSFAGQTFHFSMNNGTANMDTGGGPVLSMPPALVTAYTQAVSAAVNSSAASLDLFHNTTNNCVASMNKTHPTDLAAIQAVFPSITFVFRGRDKATAVVSAQALTTKSYVSLPKEGGAVGLCSVISVEPSSIPTAFWPSQPFFRGRFTGYDRRRNALLLSQPNPCVNVKV